MDFTDKIRLRGKAEEDLFFAKLDRQLIQAMHEKQQHEEELSKSATTVTDHASSLMDEGKSR